MTGVATATFSLEWCGQTSLELPPDLPFEEWARIGCDLLRTTEGIMWWLGDWWNSGVRAYGKARAAATATGYSLETCRAAGWVADRFADPVTRVTNLPWSFHREVASLDAPTRSALLAQAEAEGWTRRQLANEAKRRGHDVRLGLVRAKAEDLASLGKYPIVLADPPWRFEGGVPSSDIENHYPTMALEDICGLTVPAAENAVLYLWALASMLPQALEVLRAWGFTYKTSMVWVKPSIGIGWLVRTRHEHLLIATRGSMPAPADANRPDSVIEAPRGAHSAKPIVVYHRIETAYPGMPKVELFGRGPARPGWVAWGDQAEQAEQAVL